MEEQILLNLDAYEDTGHWLSSLGMCVGYRIYIGCGLFWIGWIEFSFLKPPSKEQPVKFIYSQNHRIPE